MSKIWRYGITLISRIHKTEWDIKSRYGTTLYVWRLLFFRDFQFSCKSVLATRGSFSLLSSSSSSLLLSLHLRLQRPASLPLEIRFFACIDAVKLKERKKERCPPPCSLALNAKTFHRLKVLRASAWSKERYKWLFPSVSEWVTVPECCQKLVPTLP